MATLADKYTINEFRSNNRNSNITSDVMDMCGYSRVDIPAETKYYYGDMVDWCADHFGREFATQSTNYDGEYYYSFWFSYSEHSVLFKMAYK